MCLQMGKHDRYIIEINIYILIIYVCVCVCVCVCVYRASLVAQMVKNLLYRRLLFDP